MSFFVGLVRGVLTFIGIALIAAGMGMVFGKPQAEEALRRSLEARMTEAFAAPVTIAEVHVSLLRRAIRAQGVMVASPSQFRDDPALTCDEVRVKVDPLTLLTGPPVLHRVDVQGAIMNYRYKAGAGTNIGLLTDALDTYAAAHPAERLYRVDLLSSTDARVNFSTNLVPLAKVGMRVVNVRRENLDGKNPLSSARIARIFLLSVLKEAVTLHGITDPIVNEVRELFDLEARATPNQPSRDPARA